MKTYKCLSKNSYEYGDYSIISLRKQDIYKIKDWRNSQIEILRQKKILTNESQKKYYNCDFTGSGSDYINCCIQLFL